MEDTIEKVLEEIDRNMYAHVECRYAYYGDENLFYGKSGEEQFLNVVTYPMLLSECCYKNIYNLIENIFKESLYNREDKHDNKPIVYFSGTKVSGAYIDIRIGVGLLNK